MNRAVWFASLVSIIALVSSKASAAPEEGREAERAQLREELVAQRKLNLERFRAYRKARVYPHNLYEEGRKNVWKDPDDHLCAVATMMDKAGLHELVETTAKDQNFVRVADLSTGPLVDWVLVSGFTQEEVVMIQQPTQADIEMMEAEQRREARRLARKLRREDNRLEANYITIERTLQQRVMEDASLELAVTRLAARPDLVTVLHTRTAELEQARAAKAAEAQARAAKAKARSKAKAKAKQG